MNIKGQGALEYLLLIGGAVLVAAIVIALVTGIPGSAPNPSDQAICASQFTYNACTGVVVGEDLGELVAGACCPIDDAGAEAKDNTDFYNCMWATSCG